MGKKTHTLSLYVFEPDDNKTSVMYRRFSVADPQKAKDLIYKFCDGLKIKDPDAKTVTGHKSDKINDYYMLL